MAQKPKYSDVPEGASIVHDGGYSDIPEGASVETPAVVSHAPTVAVSVAPPKTLWSQFTSNPVIPYSDVATKWLAEKEQQQINQGVGPESLDKPFLSRLGHMAASAPIAVARGITGLGSMNVKDAGVIAASAATAQPEIAGAYFGAKGLQSMTGVGDPNGGSVINAYRNPSPDNVERVLGDAAMVVGAGGTAGHRPVSQPVSLIPEPIQAVASPIARSAGAGIMRGVDRIALGKATPQRILTKALKPPVTMPHVEDAIGTRLPEIIKASPEPIQGVKDFAKASDVARDARDTEYQHLISPYRPPTVEVNGQPVRAAGPYIPTSVDMTPAADAQMRSIPITDLIEKPASQRTVMMHGKPVTIDVPGILGKTAEVSDRYRGGMPLGTADAVRVDTNAKLKSFYNKARGDQFAALSDPETARTKALNDTSRYIVYNKLQDLTGVDPRPIQNAFGDLTDISDVANKRGVVYGRQNPFPLQEQINSADAIANGNLVKFGLSKLFGRYGNSDQLVKIAVDRFNRANPTEATTPESVHRAPFAEGTSSPLPPVTLDKGPKPVPEWPEEYSKTPDNGGGANYSAADLNDFKQKHGITDEPRQRVGESSKIAGMKPKQETPAGAKYPGPDKTVPANEIEPLHGPRETKKLKTLTESMKQDGWVGRPILAWDNGGMTQALTGSHRIAAAKAAGIDVPVYYAEDGVGDFKNTHEHTIDEVAGNGKPEDLQEFFKQSGDKGAESLARIEASNDYGEITPNDLSTPPLEGGKFPGIKPRK